MVYTRPKVSSAGPLFQEFVDALVVQIAGAVVVALQKYPPVNPRLLTVAQAAVYIGRSEKSVRHLAAHGAFPTVRVDGRVMFDIQDLDRWIEQNKIAI